jgi:hypothetical protein
VPSLGVTPSPPGFSCGAVYSAYGSWPAAPTATPLSRSSAPGRLPPGLAMEPLHPLQPLRTLPRLVLPRIFLPAVPIAAAASAAAATEHPSPHVRRHPRRGVHKLGQLPLALRGRRARGGRAGAVPLGRLGGARRDVAGVRIQLWRSGAAGLQTEWGPAGAGAGVGLSQGAAKNTNRRGRQLQRSIRVDPTSLARQRHCRATRFQDSHPSPSPPLPFPFLPSRTCPPPHAPPARAKFMSTQEYAYAPCTRSRIGGSLGPLLRQSSAHLGGACQGSKHRATSYTEISKLPTQASERGKRGQITPRLPTKSCLL